MKNKKFLLILVILFTISAFAVSANVFDTVFGTLVGERFDMEAFYDNYAGFIDFLIYLTLFLGVSKIALGKRFEGRAGQGVIIAIGVSLAVALAIWGRNNDFGLTNLGPIAGIIFLLIIFYAFYKLIRQLFGEKVGKTTGILVSILFCWFLAQAIFPELMEWVYEIPVVGSILNAAISLIVFIAFMWIFWAIFKMVKGMWGWLGNRRWGGIGGGYTPNTYTNTNNTRGSYEGSSTNYDGDGYPEYVNNKFIPRMEEINAKIEDSLNRMKDANQNHKDNAAGWNKGSKGIPIAPKDIQDQYKKSRDDIISYIPLVNEMLKVSSNDSNFGRLNSDDSKKWNDQMERFIHLTMKEYPKLREECESKIIYE